MIHSHDGSKLQDESKFKMIPQTISNWYGGNLPLLVPLFEPVVARKRPQSCYLQAASNAAAFDNIVPNRWDLPELGLDSHPKGENPPAPNWNCKMAVDSKMRKGWGFLLG